jgi:hypothetical protein
MVVSLGVKGPTIAVSQMDEVLIEKSLFGNLEFHN